MTSTSFNVGLDNNRMSSRVLQPPGGGHTDIFGGEPEIQRTGRRMVPNSNATCDVSAPEGKAKPSSVEALEQNVEVQHFEPAPEPAKPQDKPVLQDKPAPQHTPAPQDKPAPQAAVSEPPKRKRVPPGGFSTPLW